MIQAAQYCLHTEYLNWLEPRGEKATFLQYMNFIFVIKAISILGKTF